MSIIAFDQSTTTVGYAIFEENELIQYGSFTPKQKKKVDDRIYDISNFLKKVISTVPNIEIVLLEDIQLQNSINGSQKYFSNQGNNVITFKALAKLQGVLINVCLDEGVEYSVVSPSHWKSIVKIKSKYRRDQKKEAMEFVDSFFGENATEDEADAICIGYSYIKEKEGL